MPTGVCESYHPPLESFLSYHVCVLLFYMFQVDLELSFFTSQYLILITHSSVYDSTQVRKNPPNFVKHDLNGNVGCKG